MKAQRVFTDGSHLTESTRISFVPVISVAYITGDLGALAPLKLKVSVVAID